jgi:hypothetical protein
MLMRGWGGDGGGGGEPVQITGSGSLEGGLGPKYIAFVFVFFSGIIL